MNFLLIYTVFEFVFLITKPITKYLECKIEKPKFKLDCLFIIVFLHLIASFCVT
jgi:hypothetical protein